MRVVSWEGGTVTARSSVVVSHSFTGAKLRDSYLEAVSTLTFGLARVREGAIVIGPLTLLRLGTPRITRTSVDWPIEGGLLARRPGGHWRLQASRGLIQATVTGYTPRLPRPLYQVTHLQVHQLFTRLYLLSLRGRDPLPGPEATPEGRFRAGTVDVAVCLTLTGFPRRLRLRRTLLLLAAYHAACWSVSGRTLGGLVMRQRVVAVDGSRITPAQSMLRLALIPVSLLTGRPIHDKIAATEVIADS
jgi:RDD family